MREEDDTVFWKRLAEMPYEEHEQECVLRREHIILRLAMLKEEQQAAKERGDYVEAKRIGVAHFADGAQLALLNERIKYLRRLMDVISWKNTIKKHLGDQVFEELLVWRIEEERKNMPFPIPEAA